jgi:hypothetical protein
LAGAATYGLAAITAFCCCAFLYWVINVAGQCLDLRLIGWLFLLAAGVEV